jgi:hypothetical protein
VTYGRGARLITCQTTNLSADSRSGETAGNAEAGETGNGADAANGRLRQIFRLPHRSRRKVLDPASRSAGKTSIQEERLC